MNRIPLIFSLICFVIYRIVLHFTGDLGLSLAIFILPISMLIANLLLRKSLTFKSWYLGPFNLMLERKNNQHTSDISDDLLYEKILEVIEDSEFDLFDQNRDSKEILCGTKTPFLGLSWGENIYIQINSDSNDSSFIQFTSTSLFGSSSWGRNQRNYESFVQSFEEALTI